MESTYKVVSRWNEAAGKIPAEKGTPEYWKTLENQVDRIQEELDETKEAIANRDLVELLDGGCDLDVTVAGLNFLTDLPYEEAISRVLANNEAKLTTDFDEADDAVRHYEGLAHPIPCYVVTVTVDDETYYSVHREFDDKIMKLLDHPRVSLKDLVGGV